MAARAEDDGAILACQHCAHAMCCSRAVRGGRFEPAYLTITDTLAIELVTNTDRDEFSISEDQVDGQSSRFLRTLPGGGCVFFDVQKRRCRIYEHRPIDCRLFPLDVVKRSGEYLLIAYTQGPCTMTDAERARLVRYFDEVALPKLGDSLEAYAQAPTGLWREGMWVVLKSLGSRPLQGVPRLGKESAENHPGGDSPR